MSVRRPRLRTKAPADPTGAATRPDGREPQEGTTLVIER
jgi:hypothetical protein